MIGQTWTFKSSDGLCTTWIDILPGPVSSYYPTGTINLHYSKSSSQCYWDRGSTGTSIDFLVSPVKDGSFFSKGWVVYGQVKWCPFNPCSQEIQKPSSAPYTPYMIIPPVNFTGTLDQTTSYDRFDWPSSSANFQSFISMTPSATVYWRQRFIIDPVTGELTAEAWEGACGHERAKAKPGTGYYSIEDPNDGSPEQQNLYPGVVCTPNPSSVFLTRIN
jgi:hypothetical protein